MKSFDPIQEDDVQGINLQFEKICYTQTTTAQTNKTGPLKPKTEKTVTMDSSEE